LRKLRWAIVLVCAAWTLPATADMIYLADVIKLPAYASALTKLLRSARGLPEWTRELARPRGDYVGVPLELATIGATTYELFNACKPHECADSRVEVMFAPDGARAWAGVYEDGKPITWLGAPNLAQKKAMEGALQPQP
jgi:hypothetical protein